MRSRFCVIRSALTLVSIGSPLMVQGRSMPCSDGRQGTFCARALHLALLLALRSVSCACCCLRLLYMVQFACGTPRSLEQTPPFLQLALALTLAPLRFAICSLCIAPCALHFGSRLTSLLRYPSCGRFTLVCFLRFSMYVLQVARCIFARQALCLDPCACRFTICASRS